MPERGCCCRRQSVYGSWLRAVDGGVEVSAINPQASMSAIDNPNLRAVAGQVGTMLEVVVANI